MLSLSLEDSMSLRENSRSLKNLENVSKMWSDKSLESCRDMEATVKRVEALHLKGVEKYMSLSNYLKTFTEDEEREEREEREESEEREEREESEEREEREESEEREEREEREESLVFLKKKAKRLEDTILRFWVEAQEVKSKIEERYKENFMNKMLQSYCEDTMCQCTACTFKWSEGDFERTKRD